MVIAPTRDEGHSGAGEVKDCEVTMTPDIELSLVIARKMVYRFQKVTLSEGEATKTC